MAENMRTLAITILFATAGTGQADDFSRLSPAELSARFTAGAVTQPPAAAYRGRVLWHDSAAAPRFRARVQSILFRGKTFSADGSFTNRFLGGITALPSHGSMGTSWVDGQPAFVMEYPPNTPLFGSYRDELREVCPGVWLGRVWNRTTGCGIGWFVLSAP